MRLASALLASAVAVGATPNATAKRPPATLSFQGALRALAAAGPRVAVATDCSIRIVEIGRARKPVPVKPFGGCRSGDASVWDVYLGRTALAAEVLAAETPHGGEFSLWSGPLPSGPLWGHGEWGWRDDDPDPPSAYGCAWSVAAGGGTIAAARVPNRLSVEEGLDEKPVCVGGGSTRILLRGSPHPAVTVAGSWSVLATDGRRIALARLDSAGKRTGRVRVVGTTGAPLAAPRADPEAVRLAFQAWLTPQGLVLETPGGITGPGWSIRDRTLGSATVALGRLLYVKGRTIRVRRLRDGADRPLLGDTDPDALLAAGSFGLAVATGTEEKTTLRHVPWRTVDRTLPER